MVVIMTTESRKSIKGSCSRVSIDSLNRCPCSTSQSILNQHLGWHYRHLINGWLIVGRVSADSYESIKNESTLGRLSTEMLKCRSSIDQGVDGVLSKYRLRVDRGYQLRVSIDTRPQMSLVHMIRNMYLRYTLSRGTELFSTECSWFGELQFLFLQANL